MLKYPLLSGYHNGHDDTLDSSYLNHPTDVQPPSGRVTRPFHGPEHTPTMDMVFSEYDQPKDTSSPALLHDGTSPLSSSFPSPSGNEMCARDEPSRSSLLILANGPGCKLDERTLSDQFRARARDAGSSGGDPWSASFNDSCSPLAREDAGMSPLQASMEAYAEIDGDFHPLPLPPPSSLSTVPAKPINKRYRRGRETQSETQAEASMSNYAGSMNSTVAPSLCSDGSRSTIRRPSVSWSPDNTTIGPSSWLSEAKGDGVLFDAYTSKPKSARLVAGHHRHNFHVVDEESDPDVYAPSSSLISEPRHNNGWEWERSTNPGQRENKWDTLHDDRYPADNSQPIQSLSAAYDDSTFIAPTTRGPWFSRRQTTRWNDERASSLVPSFYSEGSPTSESGIASRNSLASLASVLHHRYVAISYKVRLAVFRTEKRVGKRFSRRNRRMGEKDEGDDV